jgi:hypothetical protein
MRLLLLSSANSAKLITQLSLSLLFLTLCAVPALSQTAAGLEFKTGYSSFAMKDLRHTMHYYRDHASYPVTIVDEYPSTLPIGFRLYFEFDKLQAGFDYSHYATGAKGNYVDNTGERGFEQRVTANTVGLFVKVALVSSPKFQLRFSGLTSLYMSRAKFNEYFKSDNLNENDKLSTVSVSVALTPGLETVYNLTNWMYIGLGAGYCFDTTGVLHLSANEDAKLYDENDDEIHTQWSGLRTEVFVGVRLNYTTD